MASISTLHTVYQSPGLSARLLFSRCRGEQRIHLDRGRETRRGEGRSGTGLRIYPAPRCTSGFKRAAASGPSNMGDLQSKEQRHDHVRKIIDKVFDKFTGGSGEKKLSFQELYTAILLVYNDINKKVPGPHRDPPSREEVHALLNEFDTNENDLLDREEFAAFLGQFTKDISSGVAKSILLYASGPLLAMLAKGATETLPTVGPVVRRIPNFVYATVVTTALAVFHHNKTLEK